jgi:hypothetical protein
MSKLSGVIVTKVGDDLHALSGKTFDAKDAIKAVRVGGRGFRWHPESKTWRGTLAMVEALGLAVAEAAPAASLATFAPTAEQVAILADVVGNEGTTRATVVEALAGTGKTSTLELIAKSFPSKRILVVVFNKTMQVEIEERMPENVECRTFDSLGFSGAPLEIVAKFRTQRDAGWNGPKAAIRNRTEIAKFLRIPAMRYSAVLENGQMGEARLDPERAASMAIAMVEKFCTSADSVIGTGHYAGAEDQDTEAIAAIILPIAEKVWADIRSESGRLYVTNSHLTKLWALTRPDFRQRSTGPRKVPDLIMIDEAQDTAPVCESVMMSQKIQAVWVGDSNQAIYGWRGAKNALANVQPDASKRLPLTESWRFGPEIAAVGNRFLTRLNAPWPVKGSGGPGRVSDEIERPNAILCRTNGGMIGQILSLMEKGLTAAVSTATRADLRSLVETVRFLQDRGPSPTRFHEDMAGFAKWSDVENAVLSGEAPKRVEMLHRIITRHGIDVISEVVESTIEMGARGSEDAVVVVTAHKAKGLQWDRVVIADDFPQPKMSLEGYTIQPGPEELRLAYVAVTRAKRELEIGSLAWAM